MNCHTRGLQNCGHGYGYREDEHNCGCRSTGYGFKRRFISPAEEKEMLEKYKESLNKELAGVEAKLSQIASK